MNTTVLHANWSSGALCLWAEAASTLTSHASTTAATTTSAPTASQPLTQDAPHAQHPFAASTGALREALQAILPTALLNTAADATLLIRLPVHTLPSGRLVPLPSPRAAHFAGQLTLEGEPTDAEPTDTEHRVVVLDAITIPCLRLEGPDAPAALEALDGWLALQDAIAHPTHGVLAGPGVDFLVTVARFTDWLLAQQRFVPALIQDVGGGVRGLWQPWLADEATATRALLLLRAMPPIVRAPIDLMQHDAWATLEDALVRLCDAKCRRVMVAETMGDTIESRRAKPGPTGDAQEDPHVTWLAGLLCEPDAVGVMGVKRTEMLKRVRGWIGGLDQRSSDAGWRLCLRLSEPPSMPEAEAPAGAQLDLVAERARWGLALFLQSVENPASIIAAADIWLLPSDGAVVAGRRIDQPQELLLAELGRAARVYRPLEQALTQAEPAQLALTTQQAYEFLREHRPLLIEQGFGVLAPTWWDSPAARLGVRLKIDSPENLEDSFAPAAPGPSGSAPRVGLAALVNYKWQISLGQTTLSIDEFQKLATLRSPLVYVGGKWVEVRPEDIRAAVAFIRDNPGGEIEIGKALKLAFAADSKSTGVPVVGLDATGWAAAIFGSTGTSEQQKNFSMPMLDAPPGFVGSLRPYQVKGLSWLAFLDRLGLGSCLADDMGLGKTIQLLAMLLHERVGYGAWIPAASKPTIQTTPAIATSITPSNTEAPTPDTTPGTHTSTDTNTQTSAYTDVGHRGPAITGGTDVGPTLLIVPMSVVSNWVRETKRFAPSLRVMVHHGAERHRGQALIDAARSADLVVTTYALAHRDREDFEKVGWHRVALDEAQNIKNPQTKQTQAVRSIDAPRRIALTGTPVENRLTELWSIMDFLNPGLLGSGQEFRTRFAMAIEKYNDAAKGKQLRGLIQPFVLRRLKTDPQVIADLPEKVETKEFCYLTPEQASLYEQVVKGMLQQAEAADGIQRRGVILAGLTKLKQVCNHPLHYLRHDLDEDGAPLTPIGPAPSHRSGKCTRLVQMLDEVVASSGHALVFTQFRAMGEMLAATLRHELDTEVLLLHGGTSAKDRDTMVQRFQKGDGSAPIFVLSLKAGGIGLNLTAANHVFHFDRWWNPAVENQATDRAFRIGQTRTVQVHKFVVAGTLEEKIDQMIEAKASLADNVIGAGEAWLTELSLNQLRDVLALRQDAVDAAELDIVD